MRVRRCRTLEQFHQVPDPGRPGLGDRGVDAEEELSVVGHAPVAPDHRERREVALAGPRILRRHDASWDRLADLQHDLADADAVADPRVLFVRAKALELDRHPEAAWIDRRPRAA